LPSRCSAHERADLGEQLLARVRALLENLPDLAVETSALGCAQRLGGDDQHGNASPLGPVAQLAQELEPVHLGHHQVEENESGTSVRQPIESAQRERPTWTTRITTVV
jgi:hypothetical protein